MAQSRKKFGPLKFNGPILNSFISHFEEPFVQKRRRVCRVEQAAGNGSVVGGEGGPLESEVHLFNLLKVDNLPTHNLAATWPPTSERPHKHDWLSDHKHYAHV